MQAETPTRFQDAIIKHFLLPQQQFPKGTAYLPLTVYYCSLIITHFHN